MLRTCHQSVASHVIEAVRIKLAGHDGIVYGYFALLFYNIGDIHRKAAAHFVKYFRNFPLPDQKIAYVFMVGELKAESFADRLEGMTEGAMAEVMNKCCRKCAMLARFRLFTELANDAHQLPCSMKYTHTMC